MLNTSFQVPFLVYNRLLVCSNFFCQRSYLNLKILTKQQIRVADIKGTNYKSVLCSSQRRKMMANKRIKQCAFHHKKNVHENQQNTGSKAKLLDSTLGHIFKKPFFLQFSLSLERFQAGMFCLVSEQVHSEETTSEHNKGKLIEVCV